MSPWLPQYLAQPMLATDSSMNPSDGQQGGAYGQVPAQSPYGQQQAQGAYGQQPSAYGQQPSVQAYGQGQQQAQPAYGAAAGAAQV